MQKILSACVVIGILTLATGCKRDIPNPALVSPPGVSGFKVDNSTVVLSSSNDSSTVATFSWQTASYGVSIPVTYTLMIDQPSDTGGATPWANAIVTSIPNGKITQSWLGTDFNHILNLLGLPTGVASPIVARLKQDIIQSNGDSSTVPTLHNDLTMTVTPYHVFLVYPKLYVAGDFLNPMWTQKDQPGWIVASVLNNGQWEGYVNFPNSGNNFKLCTEIDWNGTNYGWGTSGTTMSGAGNAGNLWTAGPGYMRVNADTKKLTIQYTATSWVVAGSFNGWTLTGNPMTFDPATNLWTATGVSMTAGDEWKFVGDSGWNNCFGSDAKGNFVFGNGNVGNFKVAKTGTYTVTLDLSQGAGNYTYSVK
jgi:hypothetical protein